MTQLSELCCRKGDCVSSDDYVLDVLIGPHGLGHDPGGEGVRYPCPARCRLRGKEHLDVVVLGLPELELLVAAGLYVDSQVMEGILHICYQRRHYLAAGILQGE